MPPHLHPRSRSTMSLFTATLLASFFIVGLPHLFPCPAPRKAYADSVTVMTPDGPQQRVRRRRRKVRDEHDQQDRTETSKTAATPTPTTVGSGATQRELAEEVTEFREMEEEAKRVSKLHRECPVPKPRGIIGDLFGVAREQSDKGSNGNTRQSDVVRRESS